MGAGLLDFFHVFVSEITEMAAPEEGEEEKKTRLSSEGGFVSTLNTA